MIFTGTEFFFTRIKNLTCFGITKNKNVRLNSPNISCCKVQCYIIIFVHLSG